uniref:Uncharacterized protein n=1 Tax=Escherichia coli TaxID=562 RepID=A0A5S8ZI94_ECOLX|nr:hypothetical protein [Escherichia coli]
MISLSPPTICNSAQSSNAWQANVKLLSRFKCNSGQNW